MITGGIVFYNKIIIPIKQKKTMEPSKETVESIDSSLEQKDALTETPAQLQEKEKVHGVYILRSEDWKRTYVGYTVNFKQRLRRHNREIAGGAKATAGRKWYYLVQITGLRDKSHALSLEWYLKHYTIRSSDLLRQKFPVNAPTQAVRNRLKRLGVIMDKCSTKFPDLKLWF